MPVIPIFVADYLCRAKADVTLMRVLEIANTRNELPKWKKEYDWISANDETFARAWLYGYKIEEERYEKVLRVGAMFFSGGGDKDNAFTIELTEDISRAHIFTDIAEAINIQNSIGGVLEELKE